MQWRGWRERGAECGWSRVTPQFREGGRAGCPQPLLHGIQAPRAGGPAWETVLGPAPRSSGVQAPRAGGPAWEAVPGPAPRSSLDSSSWPPALQGRESRVGHRRRPSALAWVPLCGPPMPSHRAQGLTPSCWCQQLPVARRLSLPLLAGAQL